ncbi:hypothetical protein DWU98_13110 [Dyella monticola]|uniref:Pilus assembly protein n=1 Tax=Dyella monticola TaxID=1927958 RepID=A0A370WXJ2_9GAMM|nr:PilX N-terminal domain-containing pilus assembly protein [Dyella monticola]RDS80873.1 hypothetical protein DWU98_13110 [Dyella monticola]
MHVYRYARCRKHHQRGFVLLVALVFLVLMSMLAVVASQHARLQERIAGSLRNAQQARLSAETALRGAEYRLWSIAAQPDARLHCSEEVISNDGCVVYRAYSGLYASNGAVNRFRAASGWITGIGVTYQGPARRGYTGNANPTAALAKDPVYIIEDLGSERPPGVGGLHESGNTGPDSGNQIDMHIYRVTARATGGRGDVVTVMQSTFDAPGNL